MSLSSEEKELLKGFSKDFNQIWQVSKRLEAIRLLDAGLSVATVSQQLCINQEIVYKYVKSYRESGIEGLVALEKPGRESKLTEEHMAAIEKYIEDCRKRKVKCTTTEQVVWVRSTFGVIIGAKWLYKRLLIRKQQKLDHIIPVLLSLIFIGNELSYNRIYRKVLFLMFHTISIGPLFSSVKL